MTGYTMRLPSGVEVPQLVGNEHYKYLGTEMPSGWARGASQECERAKVCRKCKTLLWMIGSVPGLTDEMMGKVMSLAVAGVIGFYARATVITFADCQKIEAARAEVLRAKGRASGTPRLQIFASFQAGGMGEHEHAYVYAAASIMDQFDRNLGAPRGSPGRVAVESAIARTCVQLGCRDGHPLEWDVAHLHEHLDEEMLVEAWMCSPNTG